MCKCVWVRGEGGQFIKIAWNRFSYKAIFFFLYFILAAAGNGEALHDTAREERQRIRRPAAEPDSANWETGSCWLHQHGQQGEITWPIKSKLRPIHGHAWLLSVSVGQSWSQVIRQTEALGRVMRSHADDLNSGPLHRLATLIRDKQQVKKSYQSLHQQLESHNHKVCWENKNLCKSNSTIVSVTMFVFFPGHQEWAGQAKGYISSAKSWS